jgi:hypothetical protein
MANGKRETYTDLLLREICSHLAWAAAESSRDAAESNALYRAARLIGRNRNHFVSRVLRQMEWHDKLEDSAGQEQNNVR